jgi:hypothetical protein
LKPTPGIDKPIHDWDVQDYLDWRDKKHWNPGGMYATPREDYPHFRWSYGDSRIMSNPTHEGLWVWPTHNGYPDHFAQTGYNGLGNCAQGRIYPHQGDRWEILTWPGRPRNAPSEQIRQYIQKEAQDAVKQYVMEKIGVPEDKIFFTNMHYTAAVSMYNSPSYPDEDYSSGFSNYVSKPFYYEWEPLESWKSIPDGSWNALKDPEGRQWQRSSLDPDKPGNIRFYAMDNNQPSFINIDPTTTPVAGWEIGSKVYEEEKKSGDATENPYDWKPGDNDTVNPNESITEFYNRIKADKDKQKAQTTLPVGQQQIGPPAGALKNPDQYHKNDDGTYSRLTWLPSKGNVLFNWNGVKWTWQQLTPEETYEKKIQWFEEDHARRTEVARKIFPEAYEDAGDELDENGEHIPPDTNTTTGNHYIDAGDGQLIRVTPEEHELAYRLHGDNWHKSFMPNANLRSAAELWHEVI